MADKKGLVDLWVIQTNTIYRDVPFTVVTDWIQQGRLLQEDKVRPAGTEAWQLFGESSTFEVYFPRPEPERVEDVAEAHEPVELEFAWKAAEEEEGDPDMIPLIDVSLVLLIFFMMTAAVSSGVLSPIKTPPAKFELSTITTDMYWVGLDSKSKSGQVERDDKGWPVPWYSLGKGNDTYDLADEFKLKEGDLRDFSPVLKKLEKQLAGATGEVRVRIRGDETLNIDAIRHVTVELQKLEAKINEKRTSPESKISINVSGEVSEPQN